MSQSQDQSITTSTPLISFMSANYVARQLGYNMTAGWGQGERATDDYFRPIETFAERFGDLLRDVRALGFDAIDIWTAHLDWSWATPEHLSVARDLLTRHRLRVASYAGGFGATTGEFEAACRVAASIGTTILGGRAALLSNDRPRAISLLREYGLRLGIENHPEKTPEELLAQIGDGGAGTVGACVDTGWFGTQGYDAAEAIARLGEHVFHVHLKDVLAARSHHTCRFGQGVVPIEACVATLQRIGYRGPISVEHEPDDYDPTEDCRAMLEMLRSMISGQWSVVSGQ